MARSPTRSRRPGGSRWAAPTGLTAACLFITWTSDDGPDRAGLRRRPADPFARGRIHLNGSSTDVKQPWQYSADDKEIEGDKLPERLHPLRTRPGVLYDDSVETMPSFILDRAYERMGGSDGDHRPEDRPGPDGRVHRGDPRPPPGRQRARHDPAWS